MKKLLSVILLSCALTACDDKSSTSTEQATQQSTAEQPTQAQPVQEEVKIKAVLPETYIKDVAFSKNEKGVVQFNSAKDMFEQHSDYNDEDKTLKIISNAPLKIQLIEQYPNNFNVNETISPNKSVLIANIYKLFTFTNINEVELTVISRYLSGKTFGKPITVKVNREQALNILRTFTHAKNFDDLVNLAPNDENAILGYTTTDIFLELTADKFKTQIFNALSTGKIEKPFEMVPQKLNITFSALRQKLEQITAISTDKRVLDNGDTEYSATPRQSYAIKF